MADIINIGEEYKLEELFIIYGRVDFEYKGIGYTANYSFDIPGNYDVYTDNGKVVATYEDRNAMLNGMLFGKPLQEIIK